MTMLMGLGNAKYFFISAGSTALKWLILITIILSCAAILHGNPADGDRRRVAAERFQDTLAHSKLTKEEAAALCEPVSVNESVTAQVAYMKNCHACHGVDRMGASAPSLFNLDNRVRFNEFKTIVQAGRAQMPGFRLLDNKTIIALYKYLSSVPTKEVSGKRAGCDTMAKP